MNRTTLSRALRPAAVVLCIAVFLAAFFTMRNAQPGTNPFFKSAWSLFPPVMAIMLALITKEVYSSLFVGILFGGCLFTGMKFIPTLEHVFLQDGMIGALSDSYNLGILIFLVILGTLVSLMNRAGGSAAFGNWAARRIKTKPGAQLATVVLGVLIFIDDYFNCLTVGSVMRPVTDRHGIPRSKLAYIIDSTAAPVCIIAPISSWAAAVTGFVDDNAANGLALFIHAIPYNLYAILTLTMLVALALLKFDFGPMAAADDIVPFEEASDLDTKGSIVDLLIPIAALIVCCTLGMLYTGDFFAGADFVTAFSDSDASVGLVFGSFGALAVTLLLYLVRKVLTLRECMDALPAGFQAMVPAILILTFAWTLKAMTDSLGAGAYVNLLVKGSAESFLSVLPAIIFLIAVGLSFSTGTSWGTFGVLIPIVVDLFDANMSTIMIISISACMAGAVCGDHCSPISDTTIMSSAGAQCDHLTHVSTQLPYALFVAGVSFVFYLIMGFVRSPLVTPVAMAVLVAILWGMKRLGLGSSLGSRAATQ